MTYLLLFSGIRALRDRRDPKLSEADYIILEAIQDFPNDVIRNVLESLDKETVSRRLQWLTENGYIGSY